MQFSGADSNAFTHHRDPCNCSRDPSTDGQLHFLLDLLEDWENGILQIVPPRPSVVSSTNDGNVQGRRLNRLEVQGVLHDLPVDGASRMCGSCSNDGFDDFHNTGCLVRSIKGAAVTRFADIAPEPAAR